MTWHGHPAPAHGQDGHATNTESCRIFWYSLNTKAAS